MVVTRKDRENRIDKRIVDQKSYKSDFTKTEKNYIDIRDLHLKEREHMLTQIAKYRRKKRIRDWIELIFILGFICYILHDIYKDGDLDPIIKFLTT
jgi:hypothetical protein